MHNVKGFPSRTTKQILFTFPKHVGVRFVLDQRNGEKSVVVWITQKRTMHLHGLKPYHQLSKKIMHTSFKRDDIGQQVDIVTEQLGEFDVRKRFDDCPNGCFLEQLDNCKHLGKTVTLITYLVVVNSHERERKDMSSDGPCSFVF
jgi:hypothetical protein